MRNAPKSFTMRKAGIPKNGDWFRIENKSKDSTPVYIYDEIGMWGTTASDFIEQLNEVETDKIELHLNSPGGAVFDGLAIYHALQSHDAEVEVIVDALAASAASFIAMAGDSVVIMRNAQLMIHDGSTVCWGNEQDMLDTAKTLSLISDNIADIYAQKAGEDVKYWRGLMRAETWFSAEEAVSFGLADEMRSFSKDDDKETTDKWDLSFFNYAGRDHAEAPVVVRERILVANNLNKENTMGDSPKNSTTPAAPAPADPANPASPVTEPAAPAETDPPASTDPATSDPVTPANKSFGVVINGTYVTDVAQIQQHINSAGIALKETQDNSRREFVNQLVKDNKLAATNLDSTIEFALALDSDQYSKWANLQGSSATLPLLGNHGQTLADQNAPGNSETQVVTDRKKDLEGVLDMLRHSMSEEQIKATNSYKEHQALLAAE